MFSLHETTKIRLCRMAFVMLCIGPLCAVLAWSVVVHTPSYRRAHQRELAARLGCQVELGEVQMPRPGVLLYREVELSDPNNAQLLARLPFVEMETSAQQLTIRLPFPAIVNGVRIDAFWAMLRDMVRLSPDSRPVRFEASTLTLHLRDGDQTFTGLSGTLDGDGEQSQAKLNFHRAVAGEAMSEPCELTLTRKPHMAGPIYTIQFDSGTTPLPASLVAPLWPGVERLGSACHFAGRATAIEQAGQWHTELQGQLDQIDLDLLISRQFPHKLSGLASAQLQRVRLAGGRIEQAVGNFIAGPGVVSRSLIQSAETHLYVRAAEDAVSGRGNLIDYQKICIGFEIGPQGMMLRGAVPGSHGAILADARGPLVHESAVIQQPVVALVRMLVPQSQVQVPATLETVILTSALPVPSIVPRAGHEEPLPTARMINVVPRPFLHGETDPPANFRR